MGRAMSEVAEPTNAQLMAELRELRARMDGLLAERSSGGAAAFLTVREAAAAIRREPETVRKMAREGRLPAVPGRRPLLFRAEVVDAWKAGATERELARMNRRGGR